MKLNVIQPATCGECTLCCKVLEIKTDEFQKPKDQWCQHAVAKQGCSIYESRPTICAAFRCLWLLNDGPLHLRPDKIHGVLTPTSDGKNLVLHEDPGYQGIARYQLRDEIRMWTRDPDYYVVVVCGTQRSYIGAPAKFRALMAEGKSGE